MALEESTFFPLSYFPILVFIFLLDISFPYIWKFSVLWVKKSHKSAQKSQKNAPSSWVDFVYYSIIYVFLRNGILDGAFLKVILSSYWGVLTSTEDEIICIKYGDCFIPFYECTFSVLVLQLPFTTFEIEVLKHLIIASLQLHYGCLPPSQSPRILT